MIKPSITILPEHFAKMREAKRLLRQEFGLVVRLQDNEFKDHLYAYSRVSTDTRLKTLYSSLSADFEWDQPKISSIR